MDVLILANPRSGRGHGARFALHAADVLRRMGWTCHVAPLGPRSTTDDELRRRVEEARIVLACGGDGTASFAASLIIESSRRPPLYHLPCGNENLLARQWGMSLHLGHLDEALRRRQIRWVDVGRAEGRDPRTGQPWHRLMVLMAGFSVDAGIIERLHARPRHPAGYLAYLRPMLEESLHPHIPTLSLRSHGRPVVGPAGGMLVIANSPAYACGLRPCPGATMTDALLDATFMPCRNRWGILRWAVKCLRGRLEGAIQSRAAEFTIDFHEPATCQIDGDPLGFPVSDRVSIQCLPEALPLILPHVFHNNWGPNRRL